MAVDYSSHPMGQATPITSDMPANRWLYRWAWLWLLLLTAVIYGPALRAGFLLDDQSTVTQNQSITSLPLALSHALTTDRGLVSLSFALNMALDGSEPWGYHLGNLLIHWVNGMLFFVLLRRILRSDQVGFDTQQAGRLALTAAVFWLIHPLASQAVIYISQRAELMVATMMLACLYALFCSCASTRHQRLWQVATVLLCYLAMQCKLVAFTLPLIAMICDRLFIADAWSEVIWRRWGLYVAMMLTWVTIWTNGMFYLFTGEVQHSSAGMGIAQIITPWEYLYVQSGVILHYLKLSVWPQQLIFDYAWPQPRGFGEYALSFVLMGTLFAGAVLLLLRRVRWSILPLGFFLILAPTSSFLPIYDLAVEHRMYLPLAMICTGLVLLPTVPGLTRYHRAMTLLLVAVMVLFGLRTMLRVQDYRDGLTLWKTVLDAQPDSPRARLHYANMLIRAGGGDQAIEQLEQTIVEHPQDARAYNNLGEIYMKMNAFDVARRYLSRAVSLSPDTPLYLFHMAKLDRVDGKLQQARAGFEKVLQLAPNHVGAMSDLAGLLAIDKEYDQALKLLERARELTPGDSSLLLNEVHIMLAAGRKDQALKLAEQAYEQSGHDLTASSTLASAYAANGKWQLALSLFEQIHQQAVDHLPTIQRLAWLYATCPDEKIRDAGKAMQYAQLFFERIGRTNPTAWDTLAAAHAQSGQFDEAITAINEAITRVKNLGRADLVPAYEQRLKAYQQKQPWRQGDE